MLYEYTVVQPFTLPVGTGGQFRSFLLGDKISDQGTIDAVLAKNARHVSRHDVTTPPAEPETLVEADPAPKVAEPVSQPVAPPPPAPAPAVSPTPVSAAQPAPAPAAK